MTEALLQETLAQFIKYSYPNVIFRSDVAAGMKLTIGQAARHKRLQSDRAYPDMFLAEPRGGYCGLYLELKREGTRIWRQDGELVSDVHIKEQAAMMERLRAKGYDARFVVGIDEAIRAVKDYLILPALPPRLHQTSLSL